MKEKLISFKTAKLAKERGFKKSCEYAYVNDFEEEWNLEDIEYNDGCVFNNKFHNECSAPTQSLLQRWLREKHNIHIEVNTITTTINGYYIVLRGIGFELNLDGDKQGNFYPILEKLGYKVFNTYEQALEAGLFEALKLIKNE